MVAKRSLCQPRRHGTARGMDHSSKPNVGVRKIWAPNRRLVEVSWYSEVDFWKVWKNAQKMAMLKCWTMLFTVLWSTNSSSRFFKDHYILWYIMIISYDYYFFLLLSPSLRIWPNGSWRPDNCWPDRLLSASKIHWSETDRWFATENTNLGMHASILWLVVLTILLFSYEKWRFNQFNHEKWIYNLVGG